MNDKPVMIAGGLVFFLGWGWARYEYIFKLLKIKNFFDLGKEFFLVCFLAAFFALIIGLYHSNRRGR